MLSVIALWRVLRISVFYLRDQHIELIRTMTYTTSANHTDDFNSEVAYLIELLQILGLKLHQR